MEKLTDTGLLRDYINYQYIEGVIDKNQRLKMNLGVPNYLKQIKRINKPLPEPPKESK